MGHGASLSAPEQALQRAATMVLPADEPVLLAVSGGSDSVALLEAAAAVLGLRCRVAWVDHGLRPGTAREGDLVERLARERNLPFSRLDARPAPGASRGETAARRRRLLALAGEARRLGTPWVLLGHHLDDALETSLLHLLRGHRGDRAWAGMPTVRPLGPGTILLRPFLCGAPAPDRAALARYRRSRGLPCIDDPTNGDLSVPRNALRAALGAGAPPLQREPLLARRRAALARLEARLARVLALLEEHLRPEGLGCRLDGEAWRGPAGDDRTAHRTELLRLLGAALQTPRRLDLRRSTLDRVDGLLRAGRGEASLPASPGPLHCRASRAGLHLPRDPLAPEDGWFARLARTSIHLG